MRRQYHPARAAVHSNRQLGAVTLVRDRRHRAADEGARRADLGRAAGIDDRRAGDGRAGNALRTLRILICLARLLGGSRKFALGVDEHRTAAAQWLDSRARAALILGTLVAGARL